MKTLFMFESRDFPRKGEEEEEEGERESCPFIWRKKRRQTWIISDILYYCRCMCHK